jgi:hypothetical protein
MKARTNMGDTTTGVWGKATLGFFAAVLVGVIASAFFRGPSMDEFWTFWFAEPSVPLPDAFTHRWLEDMHPPLYSFIERITTSIFGPGYVLERLLNLVPMAAVVGFGVHAWARFPSARRFLMVAGVLWTSSLFFTEYFAEQRSYFAQHCFASIFIACLVGVQTFETDTPARRRALAIWLLASLALAVNLHFITAFVCGVALGMGILRELIRRRYRVAALLTLAGVVAAAPLMVIATLQLPTLLARSGGNFWIETGRFEAVYVLFRTIVHGSGANLVAGLLALWLVWEAFVCRRPQVAAGGAMAAPRMDAFLTLFAAAALSALALLAINQSTPIIVPRFLVGFTTLTIVAVALLIQDAVFQLRWAFPAMLANAVAIAGYDLSLTINEPRIFEVIPAIKDELARCPDQPVWATDRAGEVVLVNEQAVHANAYRLMEQWKGIDVTYFHPADSRPTITGGPCGALVWIAHARLQPGDEHASPAEFADIMGLRLAADLEPVSVRHWTWGALLALHPARRPEADARLTFKRPLAEGGDPS